MSSVHIDQAPASLLGAKERPPDPPPPNGGPGAFPEGAAPPPPAYTEDWCKKAVTYVCNGLAEEFGPEWRATTLELEFLAPPMAAYLNATFPRIGTDGDPKASAWALGAVLLVMGARRALALRRRMRSEELKRRAAAGERREEAAAAPTPPPPPAPTSSGPFGGALFGGPLGDGYRS